MLAPIFDEASNLVAREYTNPGTVVFGKVDCDSQRELHLLFILSQRRQRFQLTIVNKIIKGLYLTKVVTRQVALAVVLAAYLQKLSF